MEVRQPCGLFYVHQIMIEDPNPRWASQFGKQGLRQSITDDIRRDTGRRGLRQ
jgi:hypothetical protein